MSTPLLLPVFLTVLADTGNSSQADTVASAGIEEVVVYGRAQSLIGEARSASEGVVGYDDFRLPPLLRVGELVESVPGMVATQHSGTGKANQYFIRGFNLDHGTDFAVSVDGIPANMRTHGHGQGYLDLNFLIPELVETTRYRRGPYSSAVGDFGTAASMEFNLRDTLPSPLIAATLGEFGYGRILLGGSAAAGGGDLTAAFDATSYDGPWDLSEDLQQYKFYTAWSAPLADGQLRVAAEGYDSEWVATDQVPLRAVQSGLISPLGFIDPDLGGATSRYSLKAAFDADSWQAMVYAVDYDFRLFSNFTYGLDNADFGDEFEQVDSRRIYGGRVTGGRALSDAWQGVSLDWGVEARLDDISEVGLYATEARARRQTVRSDAVDELSIGAWTELTVSLSDRLRAVAGIRADHYDWDVAALRAVNSGSGDEQLISPGASLAYQVRDGVEAYVSWGRGFHSNDVRAATITLDPASGEAVNAEDVLAPSEGTEIGLRLERGSDFNLTLVAFQLELDSELVYVGDAGTIEPNDATERHGFEATAFWQATDALALNTAYTTTNARFKQDQGGGRRIPGAVESSFTLGANAVFDNGVFASARLRWLSEAPLVEDNSARADESLLVNAGIGYRRGNMEYRLDVLNALDSDDADIAYFYASRLSGEPEGGIEDIHYHPLEPRSIRASVIVRWQ